MTPAERDEVREMAQALLNAHANCRRLADGPCTCEDCASRRAVLRYVPPGDAIYLDLTVDKSRVVFCGTSMGADETREMAHALHAAADAAEETDR